MLRVFIKIEITMFKDGRCMFALLRDESIQNLVLMRYFFS